jgi:hypothetical protein
MAQIVGSRRVRAGTCPASDRSERVPAILVVMFPLSRRLGAALLWIAIALLPLRGLAASMMPASMSHPAPVAASVDEMPCHGADAEAHGAGTHEPASAPAVDDCPTCALCALCHGSVAQAPAPDVHVPALPAAVPVAAMPSALEPRAPDSLFRPPRTPLA